MKKSERTKADITAAVIELIEQTGSTDITMSMIAKKADVAVGLINYHYESKQALIIDAVRSYINERIQKDNVFITNENLKPDDMLRMSLRSYADFLADHAILSRLHIQFCLDGRIDSGSVNQALDLYLPLIKELNPQLDVKQIITALRMISSTIQMSFLQTGIKNENSFDFCNKIQRDDFIEDMISLVFCEQKKVQ